MSMNLTPSQKNASHDAMRSLEDIKETLTSSQYQSICKGLQVPFISKKGNSELWQCKIFQSLMVGFIDYGKGRHREICSYDADECVDLDNIKSKKFRRIFLQPRMKTFTVNIQFTFVECPYEQLENFPTPLEQSVLKNKKVLLPVADVDDYEHSATYHKFISGENKTFKLDDGTEVLLINKLAETFDENDIPPWIDNDDDDDNDDDIDDDNEDE